MIARTAIELLQARLGKENVYSETEDLLVLGYDSTPGVHHRPDVVVYPTGSEGVIAALEIAAQEGLPVVPRGSGTGLSGGSVPVQGGMVLCLTRMNRILEIDEENLTATCEAGVVTLDLFNAVAGKGLFYPPDPGSQKISTLGGNVAENAGGLRGLKYGVTRDYVMALAGVFADRSLLRTGEKASRMSPATPSRICWSAAKGPSASSPR